MTALAFAGQYLLVGEGQWLRVFDFDSSESLLKSQIFESQIIHGIRTLKVCDDIWSVLIWGGSLLRAVLVSTAQGHNPSQSYGTPRLHLGQCVSSCDWVLDVSEPVLATAPVQARQIEDKIVIRAALITAHNAVAEVVVTTDSTLFIEDPGIGR